MEAMCILRLAGGVSTPLLKGRAHITIAKASLRASQSFQIDPDQWRRAIRLISYRHSFHLQSKDLLIRTNLKVNQPDFSSSPSRGPSHPIQYYLSWSTPAHPKALSPTTGILVLSPNPAPSFKS